MKNLIITIRSELEKNTSEKGRLTGQRYFKEEIKLYGIKAAVIHKISKEYYKKIKDMSKQDIFTMCDELWQSGYIEEAAIACNWSYFVHKRYEPSDFKIFERWIKTYVSNWAECDTLCNHSVGTFLEMFPVYLSELKNWTKSPNRWMRRASAVSLIVPARKGKFLKEILAIADALLKDDDDMVQKGYGWMLKAAGESHQNEIFDYVMMNKKTMPRTALRYAIEKMPPELRTVAMKK